MKKIFLTGITGLVGSAFVVALHLDIIDAVRFIHSQNIQPHGASL